MLITVLIFTASSAVAKERPKSPNAPSRAIPAKSIDHTVPDYEEALKLISKGKNAEAIPLLEKALLQSPDNRRLRADYILCLTWTGAYEKAIKTYLERETELKQISYLPRNIGKSYYERREYPEALGYYRLGWANDPKDEESFKGVIFSHLRMGQTNGAIEAYLQGESSEIISSRSLESSRSSILEHLGASFGAIESSLKSGADNNVRTESLENDRAVMKLRWDETDSAIADLESILARNPDNLRARGDYIAALRKKEKMPQVLEQFEIYRSSAKSLPFWVSESAGEANLYLKRPEEAEKQFRIALEKDPGNINCLMGIFYAQTDMRQWDKASRTLDDLEALDKKGMNPSVSNELIPARGWLLLSMDKTAEAEEYFGHYLKDAATDTGLRSGLGHSYAWSNRPRMAKEQFEIIRNLDPLDRRNLTAIAGNLNELNFKNEARELASSLHETPPKKTYIEDLWETLMVEDMWRLQPEFRYVDEFGEGSEYWFSLLLEKAIVPTFSIFTQIQHQKTSSGSYSSDRWDRFGAGFRWIIIPELVLTQSFSFDYQEGGDFGSDTRILFLPSDQTRITAEYSSFSLGVPLRARIAGVTAQQTSVDIAFINKDIDEYGISAGSMWLSDSNDYNYGAVRYNQRILNEPDFKIFAGVELSAGSYSKQDVEYFSPEFEWSCMLSSKFRNMHMIRYEKRWFSDIILRGGLRGQRGYDTLPAAGITYEHSYIHSKRLGMTGNVSYDLKVYDGSYTNTLGTYLTLDWHF